MRSSLDRVNAVDHEFIKKQAYHDQNILIVSLDHPDIRWDERELLKQIGAKLYGKKPDAGARG